MSAKNPRAPADAVRDADSPNAGRRRAFGGLAVLVVAAIALFPYRNFLSDDGYIYLRFVENFTSSLRFSYNPPEPTYGMTSPAWVVLVSLPNFLLHDPVVAVKLVAVTLTAASLLLFYRLCLLVLRDVRWSVLAAALLTLDPWFAKWSLSGLENPLTLTVMLGGLLLFSRTRTSERPSWLAFLLLGLGPLCRPELFLLCPVVLLDLCILGGRRRWSVCLSRGLITALPGLTWALFAWLEFGSAVPNTITAKSVTFGHSSSYWGSLERVLQLVLGSSGLLLLAAAIAAAALLRQKGWALFLRSVASSGALAVALWCALLTAFYVAGKAPVAGRYLLVLTPLLSLCGFASLRWLVGQSKLPGALVRAVPWVFSISLALLLILLQARYTYFVTRWPRGMDENLIAVGEWLRENSREDAVVATGEIGVIGYYSQRRILDLLGLVSPEVIPALREREIGAFLVQAQPDYLVIEGLGPLVDPDLESRSELLFEADVQREGSSGVGRPTTYSVYRVHREPLAGILRQPLGPSLATHGPRREPRARPVVEEAG